MIHGKKISIVIPVYNVGDGIITLIDKIPDFIDRVYIVDDKCPINTGKKYENSDKYNNRVKVIYNNTNLGVGGAVKVGYLESIKNDYEFIVKMDGDNQMDPKQIEKLIDPLLEGYSYSKGNRFLKKHKIKNYPLPRLYGNIFLSLFSKLSSGYWDIYDPINGFTAIKRESLIKLNLNDIDNGYFFESDMMYNLYLDNNRIKDVSVEIKYFKDQIQNMSLIKESSNFFFKNLSRIFKRIKFTYFNNNFSLGTFFISVFILSGLFTTFYGGSNYMYYRAADIFAPTGIILISSISLLLTFLSLAFSLVIDNVNNPNR
jgi:dolichol-phosphate mannosyltransferase